MMGYPVWKHCSFSFLRELSLSGGPGPAKSARHPRVIPLQFPRFTRRGGPSFIWLWFLVENKGKGQFRMAHFFFILLLTSIQRMTGRRSPSSKPWEPTLTHCRAPVPLRLLDWIWTTRLCKMTLKHTCDN